MIYVWMTEHGLMMKKKLDILKNIKNISQILSNGLYSYISFIRKLRQITHQIGTKTQLMVNCVPIK